MRYITTITKANGVSFTKELYVKNKREAMEQTLHEFFVTGNDEFISIHCEEVSYPDVTKEDVQEIQEILYNRRGNAKNEDDLCEEYDRAFFEIAVVLHLELD
jgi:hypothetical protein